MKFNFLHPAYVAGIIDGEGCIYSRYTIPHVQVSSTNYDLVLRLAEFGGYIQDRSLNKPSSLGTLPIWQWTIEGERAAILLKTCRDFLIIKADKADEVVNEFYDALNTMKRPAKRIHHINKERAIMSQLGLHFDALQVA